MKKPVGSVVRCDLLGGRDGCADTGVGVGGFMVGETVVSCVGSVRVVAGGGHGIELFAVGSVCVGWSGVRIGTECGMSRVIGVGECVVVVRLDGVCNDEMRSVEMGEGSQSVTMETASTGVVSGSWTTALDDGWVTTVSSVVVGRGVLITKVFGVQSNGQKWAGNGVVGRRGTIEPLASRNSVRPVMQSGPMQTPSSALGSVFGAVWWALASVTRLSTC